VQKNAKKRAKRTANLKKKFMVRRSSRRNVQIRGFFAQNSSFKARSSEETDKLTGITPMRGYLSKHWRLAVSANRHLEENNDKGEVWVRKTVMLLWDFAHEMWEH
jgi:hypothetical protein